MLAVLCLAHAGLLCAATVFTPVTGGLSGTIATDASFNVLAFDVRGTVGVVVGSPPIGAVLVTDGAPPDPASPNTLLAAQDFVDSTQKALLTFSTSGITVSGPLVLVPATGTDAFGPISSPAVQAFLGPLTFGFEITGTVSPTPDLNLVSLSLVGIQGGAEAIPEPASVFLVGAGLLGVAFLTRRARRLT